MLTTTARCPQCKNRFPLAPAFWKFALPPLLMRCTHCHLWVKTTFAYRIGWTTWLLYKILSLVAVGLCAYVFYVYLKKGYSFQRAFAFTAIGLILTNMAAFLSALIACMPTHLVVELFLHSFAKTGLKQSPPATTMVRKDHE